VPAGMNKAVSISDYLLSPSSEETAKTHELFLARHALDSSKERLAKYGYHVVYHTVLQQVLRHIGFKVTPASELEVLFGPLDFDFLYAIHSHAVFDGHEILAPAIAAYRGIPCLGPSAPTRAISEDKVLAKQVAASIGLDVAEHKIINASTINPQRFVPRGDWILKPRSGIASDAVVKVDGESGWHKALAVLADPRHEGRDFIAEEFVPGLNLTVPVIEGFPPRTFAVFEEHGRPGDNVLTTEAKRALGAHYSAELYQGSAAEEVLDAAAEFAAEIAPFDYARFDFRYDPKSKRLVFIEVNMVCNMAPASTVSRAADLHGIGYEALVAHVITHSLRRQKKRAES
jgi:D-alanine-D-alanine ligase